MDPTLPGKLKKVGFEGGKVMSSTKYPPVSPPGSIRQSHTQVHTEG